MKGKTSPSCSLPILPTNQREYPVIFTRYLSLPSLYNSRYKHKDGGCLSKNRWRWAVNRIFKTPIINLYMLISIFFRDEPNK